MGKEVEALAPVSPEYDANLPKYGDQSSIEFSDDDGVIIPKGSLDPVYEAKAKVVNKAVSDLHGAPQCGKVVAYTS